MFISRAVTSSRQTIHFVNMFRSIIVTVWISLIALLTTVLTQSVQELPKDVSIISCIPLADLQDAMVQRGLGETRKVRKVRLYLMGNVGFVDVSVSVATSFLNDPDPSSTSAVYHCGRYVGPAGDFMVSFSCMQDDPEGLSGYAIYARFNGELSRGNTICQMDIVLHDKNSERIKQSNMAIAIIFGMFSAALIAGGIGVIVWYIKVKNKIEDRKEGVYLVRDEDVLPVEEFDARSYEFAEPAVVIEEKSRQSSSTDNDEVFFSD